MRRFVLIVVSGWLLAAAGSARAAPPSCGAAPLRDRASLLACIRAPDLWRLLQAFQTIADTNRSPGGHPNRDTGTTGYFASVRFVAALMRKAGYHVTIQRYPWLQYWLDATPSFSAPGLVYRQDWFVARLSGAGHVTGPLLRTAGTGCTAAEYAALPRGAVALVARGPCGPDRQVALAAAAGAGAVVLVNQPHAGRIGADGRAFAALLTSPAAIPVLGYLDPARADGLAGRVVTLRVNGHFSPALDENVIADSRFGNPGQVVVAEGHLDAIYGPGILDNASGSASLLDTALALAHTPTRNRLRFIWFGGEELGLLGSAWYTTHLAPAELSRIRFDLDADVTATPNFDVLVADPRLASNVKRFPPNVVAQSGPGNAAFLDYFRQAGIPARPAWFGNDGTDSNSFSLVGVPNTGILTNQDCCKTAPEIAIWGGARGDYDGVIPGYGQACVDMAGRWCDTIANTSRPVLLAMSKAVAAVTWDLAQSPALPAR